MKPRNEEQKLPEAQGQIKKPRFHIEKLEERIAPHHKVDHVLGGGDHCRPNHATGRYVGPGCD